MRELLDIRIGTMIRANAPDPAAYVRQIVRLGFESVELCELRGGLRQIQGGSEDERTELSEQPLDLPVLFRGEQGEIVVCLDDLERLILHIEARDIGTSMAVVHAEWYNSLLS